MTFIDTHTHLYLPEFDADRADVLLAAANEGVTGLYLPNIDLSSIPAMLQLETAHPNTCHAMMGLHPCSVDAGYKEALQEIERWLGERPFAAVGEVGLDYYWDKTFVSEQKSAFEQQVLWARDLQLPVVIHSRNSTQDCIDIIRKYQDGRLRGIFHCFGGSLDEAQQVIQLQFLLGIGGVITYKNAGVDQIVSKIPLSSMVLETDAPYLAPVPFRGKRNQPAYLRYIAEKLAQVLQCTTAEVAATTTQNALNLFRS